MQLRGLSGCPDESAFAWNQDGGKPLQSNTSERRRLFARSGAGANRSFATAVPLTNEISRDGHHLEGNCDDVVGELNGLSPLRPRQTKEILPLFRNPPAVANSMGQAQFRCRATAADDYGDQHLVSGPNDILRAECSSD